MALSARKLYYRRDGVDYSLNLYTTLAEVGTEAMALQSPDGILYAGIGSVGDARESHMRVYKDDIIKSILAVNIAYNPVWTVFGGSPAAGYTEASNTYTVNVDYNKIFSAGSPYNIRLDAVLSSSGANSQTNGYVRVDGTLYYIPVTPTTYDQAYSRYFRLATGSHTIRLYSLYQDHGEEGHKAFTSYGYVVQ